MPHTNNNKLMSILMSTTPRKGQTSNIEISIIHILSIDTFSTHSNFLAISLLLFVCGIYFSFLLGLLYAKYYSSEVMLLKASKRRSGLIQNMFLLLIFLV